MAFRVERGVSQKGRLAEYYRKEEAELLAIINGSTQRAAEKQAREDAELRAALKKRADRWGDREEAKKTLDYFTKMAEFHIATHHRLSSSHPAQLGWARRIIVIGWEKILKCTATLDI